MCLRILLIPRSPKDHFLPVFGTFFYLLPNLLSTCKSSDSFCWILGCRILISHALSCWLSYGTFSWLYANLHSGIYLCPVSLLCTEYLCFVFFFFLTFPIECPHSGISMLHCMWAPPCDMASTLSRKPIFLVLSHSSCCHSVWNCLGPGNLLLKESSPFHFVPRTVSARESQQVLKLSWF